MISGIFHQGSGLGNQLFRYITVRTLAKDKGYDWGFTWLSDGERVEGRGFKGEDFMSLDYGGPVLGGVERSVWEEKKVVENGVDIRSYDPEINFVQDNTVIDGEFQDDKYWRHKLPEIDKWLAVEPLEVSSDVCVIGFRGGEYYSDINLGLPLAFYQEAMLKMFRETPVKRFQVHTDDPKLATEFFPNTEIVSTTRLSHSKHSSMGYNWRAMRYAQYAIIANSSFYILPRILSGGMTVAPRYWARYKTKTWALPSNYYTEFTYI